MDTSATEIRTRPRRHMTVTGSRTGFWAPDTWWRCKGFCFDGYFTTRLNQCLWQTRRYFLHVSLPYLGIPIFIKVIYACDTPSITVGVIHMAHVACPVSGVTCHHCLKRGRWKSVISKSRHAVTKAQLCAYNVYISYVSSNNRRAAWTGRRRH